jgi:integrase
VQADRRFAANNYLKTMRGLCRWAKDAGHLRIDPTVGVSFLSEKTDGYPPWTEEDVEAYCRRWAVGTREWIAFQVLLNTGLRRGDAVVVGRPHVRDGVISIRTEKTGETVSIPILPELADALAIGPVGEMTFIATASGRPMVKEYFGNWFRDSCRAAGVKKSAHGLRKLSATRFSEAGVTEDQLSAWFGWGTIGMSRKYTKAAQRKVHAREAAKTLLASRPNPAPVLDSPAPDNMVNEINGLQSPIRKLVGGEKL